MQSSAQEGLVQPRLIRIAILALGLVASNCTKPLRVIMINGMDDAIVVRGVYNAFHCPSQGSVDVGGELWGRMDVTLGKSQWSYRLPNPGPGWADSRRRPLTIFMRLGRDSCVHIVPASGARDASIPQPPGYPVRPRRTSTAESRN